MLDSKLIQEQPDNIAAVIRDRRATADIVRVVALQEHRMELLHDSERLRTKRNANAEEMRSGRDRSTARIKEGRLLKEQIAAVEQQLRSIEQELQQETARIPNLIHPDTPRGHDEAANKELRRVGEPPRFDFAPRDHIQLGHMLDLFDFDRGARVAGPKFYYLRNEGALLELALTRYALDVLRRYDFQIMITPDIAHRDIAASLGYAPRGIEGSVYSIAEEDTCLIATAEITLGGYYYNEILEADQLPLRLGGFSHCFRREAGGAGQQHRGLYRVHQFSKVEMFLFCRPEQSEELHEELVRIEEEICAGLGLAYRVVDVCSGDLGAPAYRKFDIEVWMPGRGDGGEWGEVTSASNCTDYQARRLGVRLRERGRRGTRYVHMLNGTALAVPRIIIALLENHQRADGSVAIPATLQPYVGFDQITPLHPPA